MCYERRRAEACVDESAHHATSERGVRVQGTNAARHLRRSLVQVWDGQRCDGRPGRQGENPDPCSKQLDSDRLAADVPEARHLRR